ncbi:MAG: hypothetical protein JXR70_02650 [Spirochaetales bacterium]|nr:hypothetical protein [Spirochaetales bacterium]
MKRLENLKDRINSWLRKKELPRIMEEVADINELFEKVIRVIWTVDEQGARESLSVEVAQALKPYYGGKKIEDALDGIILQLEQEARQAKEKAALEAAADEIEELKKNIKNSDFVPSFEQLMKIKELGLDK